MNADRKSRSPRIEPQSLAVREMRMNQQKRLRIGGKPGEHGILEAKKSISEKFTLSFPFPLTKSHWNTNEERDVLAGIILNSFNF